jgi:aconitate hydratase
MKTATELREVYYSEMSRKENKKEKNMNKTLTEKILDAHIVDGKAEKGSEIGIRIDQTLTQDATGTMAYLEYEAIGIPRVKTERSVAYIDHNTLQNGFENADDHRFIGSVAKKYGIYYSRPGNGICHQVHLERFGIPGKTLIGSDSHTPTGGGLGMLAIGAGGLDVAVAMGGGAYYITYPKVVKVELKGKLNDWVSAKDIILEVLRRMTVKGGVGKVIEYTGEGVKTLSVPERATITNMGAELGATTSIFPSDEITREFLAAQGREQQWVPLAADEDAVYDEEISINLRNLVPLAACPHSPDNVKTMDEIGEIKIDQVCIGSCTNSSLLDMLKVAHILKGKTVHPDVSLSIAPGSKQVLTMLSKCGALDTMIDAGARILESACGPCIGMGQSPNSGGISLRTFNRNFEGRSGTKDGQIYLVSPETAAVSAITGVFTDPRTLGEMPKFELPEKFDVNDNMITAPAVPKNQENPESIAEFAEDVEILRGPNIKPFPKTTPLAENLQAKVSLKVGNNITTDHIMPAGAKILPLRSNIPAISEHCFTACDTEFPKRAKELGSSVIVGGANYGQGSSREHAALAPLYLGVKAVLVKSFARIHRANLINAGILPLTFVNETDYDKISLLDEISLDNLREKIQKGESELTLKVGNEEIKVLCELTGRTKDIILAGGLLDYTRAKV